MSRERGGDRHPNATEGKHLYRILVANCGVPTLREGLLGPSFTAKQLVKILEKSGKWVTNVKTIKGKINYVQTMLGRHKGEWRSEKRSGTGNLPYYQYVGNVH